MEIPPAIDPSVVNPPASPRATRRPGPPARAAGPVGGSRSAPTINRRAHWPGFAVFLLATGGMSIGLGIAAADSADIYSAAARANRTGRGPGVDADDREVPPRSGNGRSDTRAVVAAAAAPAPAVESASTHRRIRCHPGRDQRSVLAARPLGARGQRPPLGCAQVQASRSGGRGLLRHACRGAGSAHCRARDRAVDTAPQPIPNRSPTCCCPEDRGPIATVGKARRGTVPCHRGTARRPATVRDRRRRFCPTAGRSLRPHHTGHRRHLPTAGADGARCQSTEPDRVLDRAVGPGK